MFKAPLFWLLFSLLFVFGTFPAMAFEDEAPGQPPSHSDAENPGLNPGRWLVSLFRDHISAVDGDRCPSFPSCASYSLQAFEKHGFIMGWLMTVDRLIHEGKEETSVSPMVYTGGNWRIYDPVENNDFWWYPGARAQDE